MIALLLFLCAIFMCVLEWGEGGMTILFFMLEIIGSITFKGIKRYIYEFRLKLNKQLLYEVRMHCKLF